MTLTLIGKARSLSRVIGSRESRGEGDFQKETMPGWDDALDLQNDLRRSLRSPEGQNYLEWFSRGQSKGVDSATGREGSLSEEDFQTIVKEAVATVERGDPMWVDEEVLELVQFAAETFKPEAVYPHDLIIPDAFCLLASPMAAVDMAGRLILFRAVSWGIWQSEVNPGLQGIAIALWSHAKDDDAYDQLPKRIAGCPLVLKHMAAFRFGDKVAMAEPTNHILFKQIQVLWRLAAQTIVTMGSEQVSRPVWRRKSNWRQIKHVQVLTLRRAKRPPRQEGESEVEWTHRWAVRGHWRDQWYPSMKEHFQIWIDGYVKGPDDKPFIAKQRAVEFIR